MQSVSHICIIITVSQYLSITMGLTTISENHNKRDVISLQPPIRILLHFFHKSYDESLVIIEEPVITFIPN